METNAREMQRADAQEVVQIIRFVDFEGAASSKTQTLALPLAALSCSRLVGAE